MKYLLSSVAIAALFAMAAPVWGQGGGNPMGMPGPSPGGPGLTPYSTGAPPPAPTPSGQMPAGGKATSTRTYIPATSPPAASASDTTSATPPTHRHARAHHATHGKMAHGPKSVTDNTAQLNRAELARLQQGAPPMAPQMAPPPPPTGTGFPRETEHGTVQH